VDLLCHTIRMLLVTISPFGVPEPNWCCVRSREQYAIFDPHFTISLFYDYILRLFVMHELRSLSSLRHIPSPIYQAGYLCMILFV
jgi:hypothetical protein